MSSINGNGQYLRLHVYKLLKTISQPYINIYSSILSNTRLYHTMNNSYHFNPTMQFYVLPQCLLLWNSIFHGRDQQWSRAPSQYPKRRLFVKSRKVSKPRDLYLELSDRSEIWQALRQQCCRCACQISKRYDNSKYQSRGFETLRDLTKRRLFGYWDGALHPFNAKVSKTLSDANHFNLGIDIIFVPHVKC